MLLQIDESDQQPMLFRLIKDSDLDDAIGIRLEMIGARQCIAKKLFHQVVAYGFGQRFYPASDPDRFPFTKRIHNNAGIAARLCRGRIAPDLRKVRSDGVSGIRSHEGLARGFAGC